MLANHILAREGVVGGFGHVSIRDPADPNRYWPARSMAPALVSSADLMQYDLDSTPIDAQGRSSYLEAQHATQTQAGLFARVWDLWKCAAAP